MPDIPLDRSSELTDAFITLIESDPASPLDGPPIDVPQLLQNCLGMPVFAVSLLEEFARTADGRIEAFEERFKEANLTAVAELAHALKGVAGILGAQPLREIAIELEATCQRQDLLLTAQLVHTVRTGVERVQQDIPEITKSLLPGNGRNC